MNLIEGIQQECDRCRELLRHYESIGAAGQFGKAMIQQEIQDAEAAVAYGDTVAMVRALAKLKECK